MPERADRLVLLALALALAALCLLVMWPFATWIVIAIWLAVLLQPVHAWLARALGRRPRLAAALAVGALVMLLVPVGLLFASLAADAVALVERALASDRVQGFVQSLVSGDGRELALGQTGRAWGLAQQIAGTAARIVIGAVILIAGVYAMLVDGGRWYSWLERHAPLPPGDTRRLAGAFVETGRGLVFGVLGAGLAQAIVATGLYVVLAIPRPFALGALTLACSIIPALGTAIVWIPIAVALAIAGRTTEAVILAACGALVISTIDNLVRPYLARRGQLHLPTYVVLIAMFGGVAIWGGRGLIIGPLVVRLAKEALVLVRVKAEQDSPAT